MQKQLEGEPKKVEVQIELPISMSKSCTIVSNTHALPAEQMLKVIKLEQPFTIVAGFCFNNIFCAATNFGCIDSFLRPIPETKK